MSPSQCSTVATRLTATCSLREYVVASPHLGSWDDFSRLCVCVVLSSSSSSSSVCLPTTTASLRNTSHVVAFPHLGEYEVKTNCSRNVKRDETHMLSCIIRLGPSVLTRCIASTPDNSVNTGHQLQGLQASQYSLHLC